MRKVFVIQVEYPDCDTIPSSEIMQVAKQCLEQHMERHFGVNIMDGDCDRIKVKEISDFFSLAKRMRKAQVDERCTRQGILGSSKQMIRHLRSLNRRMELESEFDEHLKIRRI